MESLNSSWRKSSYSGTSGGNCVEVASACGVSVRDAADRDGGTLHLTAAAWRQFVATMKH